MTAAAPDPLLTGGQQPTSLSDYPYELGSFSRSIKTSSPEAQTWFNRGLIWSYAFGHAEALKCFIQAILCDPECAMAYWGYAYALGPNYNKPWELFDAADLDFSLKRCRLASRLGAQYAVSPVEKALAEAVVLRYGTEGLDYPSWNAAYAEAMEEVYKNFGGAEDLDIAALCADSRMNLAAWRLWDLPTGKPNELAQTFRIKGILDDAFKKPESATHPGLLHFYIHLMELSPEPEKAIPAANYLRSLVPDAGHLNHMPSHIDILMGDYVRAIASNKQAAVGDEKYKRETSAADYYTFYRLHVYQFIAYAAMLCGQFKTAWEACDRMDESLPDSLLRVESPPMADWLEMFKPVRLHVLVRFGKWQEIIDLAFPEDRALCCTTTATQHYARGIAYGVLGDIARASDEREQFIRVCAEMPKTRMTFPNTTADVLAVARAMLDGEIEYRKGNFTVAFEHLRESVRLSDNLVYAEPWGWMQPARHAYAALLLEQGRVEEAEKAYAEDLGFDSGLPRAVHHPNNVWALHGYHECLTRLGKDEMAGIIAPKLRLATELADVPIKASCFCRKTCCSA